MLHPSPKPAEAATLWQLRGLTLKLRHWHDEALADAARIKAGYNPTQPRVPRGNPEGGQWTDAGGRSRLPRDPLLIPVMIRKPPHLRRPGEDVLEGGGGGGRGGGYGNLPRPSPSSVPKSPEANAAVPKIQRLDRRGAEDLQDVLQTRAQGRVSPKEMDPLLRDAADDIEKFLGGKIEPKDIKPSKSGDLIILKDKKKFRMDVKKPGWLKDRKTLDQPHFHFEEMGSNGKWQDATDLHKNYFERD